MQEQVPGADDAPGGLTLPEVLPEVPYLVCAPDGVVLRTNSALLKLAGLREPGEVCGRAIDELLTGSGDALRLLGALGEIAVRATRWDLPGCGERAVLLTDCSDLIELTESLGAETRRFEQVQRIARMAFWEYDRDSGRTTWSTFAFEAMGLTPDAVTPSLTDSLDHIHPDDRESFQQNWEEVVAGKDQVDLAYRLVSDTGDELMMRGVAVPAEQSERGGNRVAGYVRDVTDQWRAEQAVATERANLLQAQRIARLGSWSLELATGELQRSEVLLELYHEVGVEPDDDVLANVHPDDRRKMRAGLDGLIRSPSPGPFEAEVRGDKGGRVYVSRVQPVCNTEGEPIRLQGTIQDITQRRLLELQLSADRRKLCAAQEAASVGTWEWNPETGEVIASEMLRELGGISTDEQVSLDFFLRMIHHEDRARAAATWDRLAENREPSTVEFRLERRDGSIRIMRMQAGFGEGALGDSVVVGTWRDVTEQRMAETRMLRSSQRFTDLVALTPVGIGLFDDKERLLDANDALCMLLGYSLDELRGGTMQELLHTEQGGSHPTTVAEIYTDLTKKHRVPEAHFLRSDGESVYCEVHLATSVQDDGRRFWIAVFMDITEQRKAANTLRHQATHDELTGLPNRLAAKELLANLLDVAEDDPVPDIAVLFCDIDNFKRINDSLGHDAGDELLVTLAHRLEDGLPRGCSAARFSGDEFVIICADLGAVGGVDALANKVSALLRNAVPVRGQLVRATASIGAAIPTGGESGVDLLRFADAAMFEAKRRGAGRVATANAKLIANAELQVQLEGQLREAITGEGLTLHYQPVVGVDGTVLTAEALVRWQHPERGLLGPDMFLPVAEQGDLLGELDRWVLRTALREAAGWPEVNGRKASVAINLSALIPGMPGFVDTITDLIAEAGIPAQRVILELVETSLVDLPSRGRAAMTALIERGLRFAVDDFGTGYSSLARLKDLPAQIIKVDRQFVSGVGSDPSDFAVARAVVDMARAMGRSCVAEGVETAIQFNVLRGVGVDAYQGWLFAKPLPGKEFATVLRAGPLAVPPAR
ncbi:MAG: sensor domain-containing protein [Sciscionella sp.]